MRVVFETDESKTYKGFLAEYKEGKIPSHKIVYNIRRQLSLKIVHMFGEKNQFKLHICAKLTALFFSYREKTRLVPWLVESKLLKKSNAR